jgi:hypothetical protein
MLAGLTREFALPWPVELDAALRAWSAGGARSSRSPADSRWVERDALANRHRWFRRLPEQEQDLVHKGEWAFINTPTPDYSMALAQWWRLLESILKHGVLDELANRLRSRPEWVAWDDENLSNTKLDRVKLLRRIADPSRSEPLSLGEMLRVLAQCAKAAEGEEGFFGSQLRKEAARFFADHEPQLAAFAGRRNGFGVSLSDEGVQRFRNPSSHLGRMGLVDAAIGRTLARLILRDFFAVYDLVQGLVPLLPGQEPRTER